MTVRETTKKAFTTKMERSMAGILIYPDMSQVVVSFFAWWFYTSPFWHIQDATPAGVEFRPCHAARHVCFAVRLFCHAIDVG